jgi:nicotinate dehydrogenase subunit B
MAAEAPLLAQPVSIGHGTYDRRPSLSGHQSHTRLSALRSLGGLHNTTANEILLDEIATVTGADLVQLRSRSLDDPRAIAVVEAAVDRVGWGRPLAAKNGLLTGPGFTFARHQTAYTYVAMVADVTADPGTDAVRVTNLTVAHDCGLIINLDGVRNQIEGNVIHGATCTRLHDVPFTPSESWRP